jgi:hypothetical protein
MNTDKSKFSLIHHYNILVDLFTKKRFKIVSYERMLCSETGFRVVSSLMKYLLIVLAFLQLKISFVNEPPPQQAAGYLVVDSFTLIEASFWEYDPERFNKF